MQYRLLALDLDGTLVTSHGGITEAAKQAVWSLSLIHIFVTNGGPGYYTTNAALYIYRKAFQAYDMGYASARCV